LRPAQNLIRGDTRQIWAQEYGLDSLNVSRCARVAVIGPQLRRMRSHAASELFSGTNPTSPAKETAWNACSVVDVNESFAAMVVKGY
jgi:hypothetical protein